MTGLPFTAMAEVMDRTAIESCLDCGMIVIVQVDSNDYISDIVGAYMSVLEAYNAYQPSMMWSESFAVIFPGEHGPSMFYDALLQEEFKRLAIA